MVSFEIKQEMLETLQKRYDHFLKTLMIINIIPYRVQVY